ncbi:MAG: nitrogenase component 1, partial [Clostridiales bacterium]|nr:nitrogenase component 1 [Clostridiales bacterium]
SVGMQEALLLLAKTLPKDVSRTAQPTFNIIGSCADLFRFQADAREILRIMQGAFGIKPLCVMTSDTSVSAIEGMGAAHINLVIRREGESAALCLHERFGTPYLLGRPYGIEGTERWIQRVSEMLGTKADPAFLNSELKEARSILSSVKPRLTLFAQMHPEDVCLSVGAHADVAKGLLEYGCGELSLPKGAFWCDCPSMGSEDVPFFDEEKWSETVSSQKGILMASGEALDWANRDMSLQISNPDTLRRLNPYVSPFTGFRGALHLLELWVNSALAQDGD